MPQKKLKNELLSLMNVGPAVLNDLKILGIDRIDQLRGKTPDHLYEKLQTFTQKKHDPCMWDVFAAIIHEAETGEKRPWWDWSKIRKNQSASLNIRKAKSEDTQELELLFKLINENTFRSRCTKEFEIGNFKKSTANDVVWIAEEKGVIIGFVSIYLPHNFVHNLFVHPRFQRKNIGTQLLKTAENNLKRPLTLKVALDNLDVCSFYEKQGWYKISIHEEAKDPYVLYKKN